MVLSSADIFFKKDCFFSSKKIFQVLVECQGVWIEIIPVRPDLDPNCLQRLSADDTSK